MLERFSSHCISDLFTFAKAIQNLDIDPNVFICSFDVSSFFTNVPLDETIKVCSEALYGDSDLQPLIPKDVFVELMKSATSPVDFSFDNNKLKCLHSSLKSTSEKEKGKCLPFLDVYVERTDISFKTTVYRKPTFTGQYLRWEFFSPPKRRISRISTLVHRALMICTKRRLNGK